MRDVLEKMILERVYVGLNGVACLTCELMRIVLSFEMSSQALEGLRCSIATVAAILLHVVEVCDLLVLCRQCCLC